MTFALIIGQADKDKIAAVHRFAAEHKLPLGRLHQLAAERMPVGDLDQGYLCELPSGFRVCFSLEEHPCGWCRHIHGEAYHRGDRRAAPHAAGP